MDFKLSETNQGNECMIFDDYTFRLSTDSEYTQNQILMRCEKGAQMICRIVRKWRNWSAQKIYRSAQMKSVAHGKIIRVIFPCSGLLNFFCFQYNGHKVCLTKHTNAQHFQTTVGYIFSKYVYCDMWFFNRKQIAHCVAFLTVFCIAVPVFSY